MRKYRVWSDMPRPHPTVSEEIEALEVAVREHIDSWCSAYHADALVLEGAALAAIRRMIGGDDHHERLTIRDYTASEPEGMAGRDFTPFTSEEPMNV